jgi:hypothetical protein
MKIRFALFTLFSTLLLSGCLGPRVDWNTRIGHYTYDQAVVELGPPDKTAKLSDGHTVAEWISRYSNGGTVSYGMGYNNYPYGPMIQTTGPSYYERHFRLTFSSDNVLTAWTRN